MIKEPGAPKPDPNEIDCASKRAGQPAD